MGTERQPHEHRPARVGRLLACLCLAVLLSGCNVLYRDPVRHLSSDICLIAPNMSKEEVVSALGAPDDRRVTEEGEVWTYRETRKSVLRKAPVIGKRIGSEEYDVIIVTFAGNLVRTCVYRGFANAEELKKSGFEVGEPLGE
ncbi:MAG: hypothetical protein ACOY3Z_09980 [Thermodesulfobacteriota bacterium]